MNYSLKKSVKQLLDVRILYILCSFNSWMWDWGMGKWGCGTCESEDLLGEGLRAELLTLLCTYLSAGTLQSS